MTARKPPKTPEDRLARWARSMTPGTVAGRVASAQPLPLDLSAKLRASPGSPNPGGNTAWQQDDFTSQVTGTPPPTAYTLTFLPISQSERIYARGRHLRPGTEYTMSGQVATLASGLLVAGDPLTADYEYYISVPTAPGTTGTFQDSSSANSFPNNVTSITVAIPASTQPGDTLLLWASSGGSPTPTATGPASGWTSQANLLGTGGTYGTRALLMSRIAQAGDAGTNVTVTFSNANRCTAAILRYVGGTPGVASAVSSSAATSVPAPSHAATSGDTCVYLFAGTANNLDLSISAPATQRVYERTGYDVILVADEQATGSTSPSLSATATFATSWCAATIALT